MTAGCVARIKAVAVPAGIRDSDDQIRHVGRPPQAEWFRDANSAANSRPRGLGRGHPIECCRPALNQQHWPRRRYLVVAIPGIESLVLSFNVYHTSYITFYNASCNVSLLQRIFFVTHFAISFYAKPGCPSHLINIYEKVVNTLPSSYLLLLVIGEVFTSIEACKQRLCSFALAKGFNIIYTGEDNK